jgi:F-type H+-transporting ATPase subunit gamma
MSLKSVKAKIKSIDKTRQVTKAMEAVSAVKMRKAQTYAISLRGYARSAFHILRGVSGSLDALQHPLLAVREEKRIGLIVISPDKGLAGSLVGNIWKQVTRFLMDKKLKVEDVKIFSVGRKANEYFGKRGFTLVSSYDKWGDIAQMEGIEPLAKSAEDAFVSGDLDAVYMIYTQFHSTLVQEVVIRKLFPITFTSVSETITGIVPEKGRFKELREEENVPLANYTFEPSPASVLDAILPLLIRIQFFHAVLESNASEHSARMLAMKNASDNAKDLSRSLKLFYNRVRQAAITREVSEIVGGMESMKK